MVALVFKVALSEWLGLCCRCLNPMFEGGYQQDCHEFMRSLLCYIENAATEVNKHKKRMKFLPPTINLQTSEYRTSRQ